MKDLYDNSYYVIYLYEQGKWKETYKLYDWAMAKDQVFTALKWKYIYKSKRIDRIVRCPLYDGTEKYTIYYHTDLFDGNKMKFKIIAVIPE